MTEKRGTAQHSAVGEFVDPVQVAGLLHEVVCLVDAGEITATSPERAYLVGAAAALRHKPGPRA